MGFLPGNDAVSVWLTVSNATVDSLDKPVKYGHELTLSQTMYSRNIEKFILI